MERAVNLGTLAGDARQVRVRPVGDDFLDLCEVERGAQPSRQPLGARPGGAAAVFGTCEGQQRVFTVQVFMKS